MKSFPIVYYGWTSMLAAASLSMLPTGCAPSASSGDENVTGQSDPLLPVDVQLAGGNEPHLINSPVNPQLLASALFTSMRLSWDGGQTWPVSVNAPIPAGYGGGGGDPVLAFDAQGRLFMTFLTSRANAGGGFGGSDLFVQQVDVRPPGSFPAGASRLLDSRGIDCSAAGATAAQCPLNITQQLGLQAFNTANPNGRAADKQWFIADTRPACVTPPPARANRTCSPFTNNLYVLWTDFPGTGGAGGPTQMRVASSGDQGANWTTTVVSQAADGFVQQADISVAANGDAWAAYHAQPGFNLGDPDGNSGQIVVVSSTTGNAAGFVNRSIAFGPGQADISFDRKQCACPGASTCRSNTAQTCTLTPNTCPGPNCQCAANDCAPPAGCTNTPIPGYQACPRRLNPNINTLTQGSAAPFIVNDPSNPNNIAIFAADDPNPANGGDDFNVLFVTAVDAATAAAPAWSATPQAMLPGGNPLPGSNQLFPQAQISRNNQCVTVAYYDDRNPGTGVAGASLLDLFVTVSPNLWPAAGAPVWQPEQQINHNAVDPDNGASPFAFHSYCGSNPPAGCVEPAGWVQTTRMGEYFGLVEAGGVVWTGNSGGGQVSLFNYSDAIAPALTAPPPVTVNSCAPSAALLGNASATDLCGLPPLTTSSNFTGTLRPGPNTLVWTATDGAMNSSTATQTVTVADNAPPHFTFVPAALTISACNVPNLGQATASDSGSGNCPVTVTNNAPAKFPLGNTTVTWTASDGTQSVTATQVVTAVLADDPSCCPTGSNIIIGTAGANALFGTAGRDCILGLAGNDFIDGAGGDDAISGGAGDDSLRGGAGNDRLYAGFGRDVLQGEDGDDVLVGGLDGNVGIGGAGIDSISGGGGFDVCLANGGADSFDTCEVIIP